MATINDLLEELAEIKRMVAALPSRTVSGKQVKVVNGLSEVDDNLGLVSAGEFRAGNRETPGQGFSGVRIAYPAMTYSSEEWHIAGVNNDTLQFGLRATDGVAVAAGGQITLNSTGLRIANNATQSGMIFEDTNGDVGGWISVDNANNLKIRVVTKAQQILINASHDADANESGEIILQVPHERDTGVGLHVSSDFNQYGRTDAVIKFSPDEGLGFPTHGGSLILYDNLNSLDEVVIRAGEDGETVFNEQARDIDFRVEGDTEANLLVVDAGLDQIAIGHNAPDTILDISGAFTFRELSADPSNPDEGSAVMWMSDGTGSGDDGDVMMKITAGGATKTATLVDFSAV